MAMIDYGAILKIDGKQINQKMFMETSDSGYCPLEAYYYDNADNKHRVQIKGNFFVYAGDEDLLLCFYKRALLVICKDEIVEWEGEYGYTGKTLFIGGTRIYITRLDKQIVVGEKCLNSRKFNKCKYMNAKLKEMTCIEAKKHKAGWKYRTNKFYCEWWHKGKHYEVVWGYGIDVNKDIYNETKYKHYEYTDAERKFLDNWY